MKSHFCTTGLAPRLSKMAHLFSISGFFVFVYTEYLVTLLHSLVCCRWAFGIVLWEICTLGEFLL